MEEIQAKCGAAGGASWAGGDAGEGSSSGAAAKGAALEGLLKSRAALAREDGHKYMKGDEGAAMKRPDGRVGGRGE